MIRSQSPVFRYISAIALPALALVLSLLLRGAIGPSFLLTFTVAVFVIAWLYGLGPGLLATAISLLMAHFLLSAPVSSLVVGPATEAGRLIVFAIVSGAIVYLVDRKRSESRFVTALLSGVGGAIVATDHHGIICFMNAAAEEITGWSAAAAIGKPSGDILRLFHEKTREPVDDPLKKCMMEGKVIALRNDVMITPREGSDLPIEESASPIRDPDGRLRGAVMLFRDISRTRQMMDQASHSQKMEAIGRLAGGVAGDFNNLLTIITGYSELLRSELLPGNPMRRFADEIQVAAERAAGVTRQLLSFSRGQVVQPKLLDVNSVIANMDTMIRRLLGSSIEVVFLPGPGLGRIKCDPGQIEQIIVNLGMNSRDAMPKGGKFVVETANIDVEEGDNSRRVGVDPGSYVMMAVSDTGSGMDAETRSRLFEPFFTTKSQGKATGLGLSIVYGIVKQNKGHITVYSELNCGTIFEVYLPRTRESVEGVHRGRPPRAGQGSETILLVDDEDGVRKLCSAVLQSNGYTVIEASDGAAGLTAYEKHAGGVDLLLTDVVMPHMNGFELAERLAGKDARMGILYMSGYPDNPAGPPGQEVRAFLHKPFTPDALLLKVRQSLDSRANGARG